MLESNFLTLLYKKIYLLRKHKNQSKIMLKGNRLKKNNKCTQQLKILFLILEIFMY